MREILTITLLVSSLLGASQPPNGYYNSALGLTGDDARSALFSIITNHSEKNYDNLWGYFNNTDQNGGVIEDIYSTYSYTIFSDQCGQYSQEGDCYNREHSVPQDWFNGGSPMYSDLFHIYPTDGFVNGQRSNLPYGEVGSASYTSTNGSKKGSNTYPGFSGTVFEPADNYKGDIARTYFYMATRYMNVMTTWSGDNFTGNTLSNWTLDMMIDWHENDPVSQKEIDRNNAIYSIQGNRNPYIDNPDWVQRVFVWATGLSEMEMSNSKYWFANGQLNFRSERDNNTVARVYNSLGELVLVKEVAAGVNQIELNLKTGIYFCSHENYTLKLVVL